MVKTNTDFRPTFNTCRRKVLGLSQTDMARCLHVTQPVISTLENDVYEVHKYRDPVIKQRYLSVLYEAEKWYSRDPEIMANYDILVDNIYEKETGIASENYSKIFKIYQDNLIDLMIFRDLFLDNKGYTNLNIIMRYALDMPQEDFATIADTSKSYINMYENDYCTVKLEKAKSIYNKTLDYVRDTLRPKDKIRFFIKRDALYYKRVYDILCKQEPYTECSKKAIAIYSGKEDDEYYEAD